MQLRFKRDNKIPLEDIASAIRRAFDGTRFVINQVVVRSRRLICVGYTGRGFSSGIRLQAKKMYCGNHPSECRIERPHSKRDFLEGADWVEFNDRLNDVLDAMSVSCDAGTGICVRRGRERCIAYVQNDNPYPSTTNDDWAKYGEYEDYCGRKAPRSDIPDGTPGKHEQQGYDVPTEDHDHEDHHHENSLAHATA